MAGTRGGPPPRGSMKLDNRPRRLLIQGVPSNDEAMQAVRTYYQVHSPVLTSPQTIDSLLSESG